MPLNPLMQLPHLLTLTILLFLASNTTTQPTASTSGILEFPHLSPYPGTLHHTLVDSSFNIYAAGTSASTSFISKRAPSLDPLWLQTLPSLPSIPPTIAFSDKLALFAIAPRPSSNSAIVTPDDDDDAPNFVDIVLYQLDTTTGSILSAAQVETVRWLPASKLHCILTSAASEATLVYITYVVQDGVEPSRARTRLVQMVSSASGELDFVWSQTLTPAMRTASSTAVARDVAEQRVVVVELSAMDVDKVVNQLSLYSVSDQGVILRSGSLSTTSTNASIEAFGVDDKENYYIGEGSGLLYRLVWQELKGQQTLIQLWNVTDIYVVDMTVLQNGSAVYVLSNGEGFTNVGNQIVRAKTPILTVYNSSGHRLFQNSYVEPVPETERQLYSLLLTDPSKQCHALLAGFVRFSAPDMDERQVSIALFTFPKLFRVFSDDHNSSQTVPIDPISPEVDQTKSNTVLLTVAIGVGVVLLLAVIAVTLLNVYRTKSLGASLEAEKSIETIPSVRDHNVLV